MFDLHFSGIGSAFCPALGNTSAWFRRDGTLYLLDCGSTVFGALLRGGVMTDIQRIVALITHLHADHVGSLGTLISYCRHVTHMPIAVVHAEAQIADLLRLNGITQDQYTLHTGMTYRDGHLRLRLVPVPHTKSLNAYGFLLDDGEETVYYSGDAGDVPEDIWAMFLNGEISRLYQDVSLSGTKGGSHGEYAWFVRHCPDALKSRFYPIHLDEACRARCINDGFGQAKQEI